METPITQVIYADVMEKHHQFVHSSFFKKKIEASIYYIKLDFLFCFIRIRSAWAQLIKWAR
jgi:hypothetical protein